MSRARGQYYLDSREKSNSRKYFLRTVRILDKNDNANNKRKKIPVMALILRKAYATLDHRF
jgi:hypothetical protein